MPKYLTTTDTSKTCKLTMFVIPVLFMHDVNTTFQGKEETTWCIWAGIRSILLQTTTTRDASSQWHCRSSTSTSAAMSTHLLASTTGKSTCASAALNKCAQSYISDISVDSGYFLLSVKKALTGRKLRNHILNHWRHSNDDSLSKKHPRC